MTVSALKKRRHAKRCLVLILLLILGSVLVFEFQLRPVLNALVKVKAEAICNEIVNKAVLEVLEESNYDYSELVETQRGDDGSVLEITINPTTVNKLKSEVSLLIIKRISEVNNVRVDIPLGTILGVELLYGKGPDIPLYITLSGSAGTDFNSSFESGGINQTVHKLSLDITVDVSAVMPPASEKCTVKTSVIIAETVLVGDVPQGGLYNFGTAA